MWNRQFCLVILARPWFPKPQLSWEFAVLVTHLSLHTQFLQIWPSHLFLCLLCVAYNLGLLDFCNMSHKAWTVIAVPSWWIVPGCCVSYVLLQGEFLVTTGFHCLSFVFTSDQMYFVCWKMKILKKYPWNTQEWHNTLPDTKHHTFTYHFSWYSHTELLKIINHHTGSNRSTFGCFWLCACQFLDQKVTHFSHLENMTDCLPSDSWSTTNHFQSPSGPAGAVEL